MAHIRLVLLGSVDEGKRSAGNTILGRDIFDSQKTAKCVIQEGSVGPRKVTVINTPGWGREQRLSQTPGNVREQLLHSVFPPGVHALLLVIRADKKFTETHRVALQDHMELLGERVWDHTIILFTCGDWLGGAPIEQFIYSEGKPLQWVVEKASYKYYCINNSDRADTSQVSGLLELVDMMVGNGPLFELDEEIYEKEKERERAQTAAIQEMQQRALKMRMSWGAQSPANRCQSSDNIKPALSGGYSHGEVQMPPTTFSDPGHLSGLSGAGSGLVSSYYQHNCSHGNDPKLSCHFTSETSAVTMEIRWFKGTHCIYLYKDGQVRVGQDYEGKVSLEMEELKKGSISLKLKNIQQDDAGTYVCQVINGGCNECTFRINYSPYSKEHKFTIYPVDGQQIVNEDREKMKASTQALVHSSVGRSTLSTL